MSSQASLELLEIFEKVLNKPVHLEDNFEDLGGESMEMQDIIGLINRTYQLKIKVKDVLKLKYIDRIIEYVIRQRNLDQPQTSDMTA